MQRTKIIAFSVLSCASFYLISSSTAVAQIVPDSTLPVNSAVQAQDSSNIISEGTKAGNNLFHSFERFSVPTGSEAFFNNTLDIQNIFSRVTGSSISNIDGLIRANGTANLFLLNPNGIIFGPNAKLDLGGSFLGSTASSIDFADGVRFSATSPEAPPLLTVDVPVGLGFGSNPGRILVQGNGQGTRRTATPIDTSVELRVEPERTLALVGGDIAMDGATLRTSGGRIELGSVADSSSVGLSPVNKGWELSYKGVQQFKDIQIDRQSTIDASGDGGGDVRVLGKNITLAGGSQIESSTLDSGLGGTLSVTGTESVELIGTDTSARNPSGIGSVVYPGATGTGGNLTVEAKRVSIRDGAQITASTFGIGASGNITINAIDSVEMVGTSSDAQFSSTLVTSTRGPSPAGNLKIETGRLSVRDGAEITANTLGAGAAGSITINATDLIELVGTADNSQSSSSGIFASANSKATGAGGNIILETGRLSVRDGAAVLAATLGQASAGNIVVNATDSIELVGVSDNNRRRSALSTTAQRGSTGAGGTITLETGSLSVRDGALITASTFGTGASGNILVNARGLIELVGISPDSRSFSFLGVTSLNTGNPGSIEVNAGELRIADRARITVDNNGPGSAGFAQINAKNLILNNAGSITATTASSEGGNIFLNSRNLQLRNGSSISATAGLEGGGGNGGNIIIDTDSLAAVNRSSITANAFTGRGGNIQITTQGIFQSPDSIFDASSQFGVDGTVEVRSLGLEPDEALVPFNEVFIPMEQVVANSCFARRNKQQHRFVITGNGGLPAAPGDSVMPMPLFSAQGLEPQLPPQDSPSTAPLWQEGDPIVEATGIIKTKDGRTLLGMVGSSIPDAEDAICR